MFNNSWVVKDVHILYSSTLIYSSKKSSLSSFIPTSLKIVSFKMEVIVISIQPEEHLIHIQAEYWLNCL